MVAYGNIDYAGLRLITCDGVGVRGTSHLRAWYPIADDLAGPSLCLSAAYGGTLEMSHQYPCRSAALAGNAHSHRHRQVTSEGAPHGEHPRHHPRSRLDSRGPRMSRPIPVGEAYAHRGDDRRCGQDRRRGDRRGTAEWRADAWAGASPTTERRRGDRRRANRRERPAAGLTDEQSRRAAFAQAYASMQHLEP